MYQVNIETKSNKNRNFTLLFDMFSFVKININKTKKINNMRVYSHGSLLSTNSKKTQSRFMSDDNKASENMYVL